MELNEPINTTALALVYMLDGFAEKVLERYAKAQKNDILLRENWILQMAMQEVANLENDEKKDEEEKEEEKEEESYEEPYIHMNDVYWQEDGIIA